MLDPILRQLCERPLARAGAALALRVSANTVTVAGFAAGIVAAALIVADLAPVALGFIVLNRAADVLDGAVARASRVTALGAFLDMSLDLIVYAALPVAFAIANPPSGLAAAFFLFGFVSMMTLELALWFWLRRGYESATTSDFSFTVPAPLIGHAEMSMLLAVACAYPPWFPLLAYVFGAACFIAAGIRLANAVALLNDAKP
jgi:phosphatidylglycerophosphate synthase